MKLDYFQKIREIKLFTKNHESELFLKKIREIE